MDRVRILLDQPSRDAGQTLRHVLGRTQCGTAGHGAGHAQDELDRVRLQDACERVMGNAAQHRDTPPTARQEHDACALRLRIQLLHQTIAVQLGSDVQVMDAACDARCDDRPGRTMEWAGAVQQDVHPTQGVGDCLAVVEGKGPTLDEERAGQVRKRRAVAACDDQIKASLVRVGRSKATGVTGRAIDHEFLHSMMEHDFRCCTRRRLQWTVH